jgi:hypothetical protein
LLLRGRTIEFYRPLRAAIWNALNQERLVTSGRRLRRLESDGPGADQVWDALFDTMARMSILPADLRRISDRGASLETINQFVNFADRARVLPHFCKAVSRMTAVTPENWALQRVADSFIRWDRAITCGGGSGW